MRFILSSAEIERSMHQSAICMLGAFLLAFGTYMQWTPELVMTVFGGVMYGAAAGSVESWNQERGIWLLTLFFFAPCLLFWAIFEGFSLYRFFSPSTSVSDPKSTWLANDMGISSILFWKSSRLLLSTARWNYRLSKHLTKS